MRCGPTHVESTGMEQQSRPTATDYDLRCAKSTAWERDIVAPMEDISPSQLPKHFSSTGNQALHMLSVPPRSPDHHRDSENMAPCASGSRALRVRRAFADGHHDPVPSPCTHVQGRTRTPSSFKLDPTRFAAAYDV